MKEQGEYPACPGPAPGKVDLGSASGVSRCDHEICSPSGFFNHLMNQPGGMGCIRIEYNQIFFRNILRGIINTGGESFSQPEIPGMPEQYER